MICPNCGKQCTDGAAFCPQCGVALTNSPSEPPVQTPTVPEASSAAPVSKPPVAPNPSPATTPGTVSQAPSGATKKRFPKALIIALALVLGLAAVGFGVLRATRREIKFYDPHFGDKEINVIKTQSFMSITLPDYENDDKKHENYSFAGWMAGRYSESPKDDYEVLEPGTTVKPDDASSYYGVWNVKFEFDGNGADEGKMAPEYVRIGESYEMPTCEYSREGYSFVGWETDDTAQYHSTIPEGQKDVYVGEPTTYRAVWMPSAQIVDVSITNLGESTKKVKDLNDEGAQLVLKVRNDLGTAIDFTVSGNFRNESGSKVGETFSYVYSLSPGELVYVNASCADKADSATFKIETEESDSSWRKSLDSNIQVSMEEANEEHIVYKITNNGSNSAEISMFKYLCTKEDGFQFAGDHYASVSLEPGEVYELEIDADELYIYNDAVNFYLKPDFEKVTMEYHLDGYYEIND